MTRKRLHAAFLSLLVFAAPPPADAAEIAIPLTRDETGHVRVDVMVNGEGPFEFVLDTGASMTTLTPALVDALGLDFIEGQAVGGQGASGAAQFQFYRVNAMTVAGLPVRGSGFPAIPVSALDGPTFYGILGADFLRQFAVSFDPERGTITFSDQSPADVSAYTAVPMRELIHGLVAVETSSGGETMTAVIDMGARFTILNEAAGRALGLEAAADADARDIQGASGHGMSVPRAALGSLRAGGVVWSDLRVGISDLPVFQLLGLKDKPALILGADILLRAPLVVDYPSKRLLIADAKP